MSGKELEDLKVLIREDQLKPQEPKKQRLICLDVTRGLTMVGMIMVDSMGDFDHVIWPLRETEWNGLTTADCVFPSFLFIMGAAVALAFKRTTKDTPGIWYKIIKRSIQLFLIGVALNFQGAIPHMFTHTFGFRIMGVLQRLAICYLIISSQFLLYPQF